jgi:hypothetical protein
VNFAEFLYHALEWIKERRAGARKDYDLPTFRKNPF